VYIRVSGSLETKYYDWMTCLCQLCACQNSFPEPICSQRRGSDHFTPYVLLWHGLASTSVECGKITPAQFHVSLLMKVTNRCILLSYYKNTYVITATIKLFIAFASCLSWSQLQSPILQLIFSAYPNCYFLFRRRIFRLLLGCPLENLPRCPPSPMPEHSFC
jgi:hypothetical protein